MCMCMCASVYKCGMYSYKHVHVYTHEHTTRNRAVHCGVVDAATYHSYAICTSAGKRSIIQYMGVSIYAIDQTENTDT